MKYSRVLALLIAVVLVMGSLAAPVKAQSGKYVKTFDLKLADVKGDYAGVDPKGTKIVWWHQHTGSRETVVKDLVAKFNKENQFGITVDVVSKQSYNDAFTAMTAAIQTGELPDVVVAYVNQAAAYQNNKALVDMDPFVKDAVLGMGDDWTQDMFTTFFAADLNPTHNNARLSFSTYRSIEVLYYNVDALKELGYDKPPATWKDFGDMVCKYVEADKGKRDGYQIRTDASFVAAGTFSAGGSIFDAKAQKFTYDAPEVAVLPTEIQALLKKGCIKKTTDPKAFSDQAAFANGSALFYTGSSSGIPFIWEAISKAPKKFVFDIAPVPGYKDKPVVNVYGASNSIVGLKKSKAQVLSSWLFLRWFSENDAQAYWSEKTNYFPVRKSVSKQLDKVFAKEGTGRAFKTAFSLLENTKEEPAVDVYQTVRTEASKAMNNIVDGANVKDELTKLNATANKLLEESAAKK